MQSNEAGTPKDGLSGRSDRRDKFLAATVLLAKVRDVSQQIVERVNKVLGDAGTHASLPTEEKSALK